MVGESRKALGVQRKHNNLQITKNNMNITEEEYKKAKQIVRDYEKQLPEFDTKFMSAKVETILKELPFNTKAKGILIAEDLYNEPVSELCKEIHILLRKNYVNFGKKTKNEFRAVVHYAQINQKNN